MHVANAASFHHRLHGEEINRLQSLTVVCNEVLPVVGRAIGIEFDPLLLEDVPHRLTIDLLDAELPVFSDDSRQTVTDLHPRKIQMAGSDRVAAAALLRLALWCQQRGSATPGCVACSDESRFPPQP